MHGISTCFDSETIFQGDMLNRLSPVLDKFFLVRVNLRMFGTSLNGSTAKMLKTPSSTEWLREFFCISTSHHFCDYYLMNCRGGLAFQGLSHAFLTIKESCTFFRFGFLRAIGAVIVPNNDRSYN